MWDLLIVISIGLVAGWLAGKVMKWRARSLFANLLIGVCGAVLGGYIFEFIGIPARGLWGTLISALVGSIFLLYLLQGAKKDE